MKFFKLNLKRIKNLPEKLARRSFLILWLLIIASFIINFFIFYHCLNLVKTQKIKSKQPSFIFQEKTYQNILKIWQEKEKRFKEADSKEYPNLFEPKLTE